MNKIDLKLIIWGIISALASFTAFVSESALFFVLCFTLSLLAMFIICLAAHPGIRIFAGVITVLGAYFASGMEAVISAVLFIVVPAIFMSFIIKSSKDFSVTMVSGTGILCIGTLIYDGFVLSPKGSGFRVMFSHAVDLLKASWIMLFQQFSQQNGIDFSMSVEYMDSYFYSMKLILPAIIILVSLFVAWMVLLLSRRFILNIPVPPFYMLKIPKSIVYTYCIGYIISGFLSGSFGMIVNNAVIVLTGVMMISGLSILRFFTKRIQVKFLSFIVFIFVAFVALNVPFVLIGVGIADSIIDFRRRRKK